MLSGGARMTQSQRRFRSGLTPPHQDEYQLWIGNYVQSIRHCAWICVMACAVTMTAKEAGFVDFGTDCTHMREGEDIYFIQT